MKSIQPYSLSVSAVKSVPYPYPLLGPYTWITPRVRSAMES